MSKSLLTVLLLSLLVSCQPVVSQKAKTSFRPKMAIKDVALQKTDTTPAKKLGIYMLQGDSVIVPPFEIEIALTPKARDRIVHSNETIIIAVSLEGIPNDSSKVHLGEDDTFVLGSAEREIYYGETARFTNLKFPKELYDQLADKDVYLTVNVYTGRKSSRNNLITGEILADKVSNIINKHFTIHQQLIYGEDQQ